MSLQYVRITLMLVSLVVGRCAVGPSTALAQTNAPPTAEAEDPGAEEAPKGPKPKGFFEILFSGGIVGIVIMLALIASSLTAAYLVFDNALSLRKSELLPESLAQQVRAQLASGQIEGAAAAARSQPGLLGFVISHGLSEADGGWGEVEKAVEEALAEQAARLYRKVEYLSVIAGIAPMLGLLGTVTGMLMAFQEVAVSQGKAGAADLAEGIYQALVTTVVGLIIAIPSLGAFAIFRNRVDQLMAEAGYMLQHALGPLKRRAARAPLAAPPPPPR